MQSSRTDCKNRKLARRKQHLSVCSEEGCNIIAHSCCPHELKISFLPQFAGMTCFEIAHSPEVENMFTTITRDGKSYQRTVPSHPICKQLIQVYEEAAKPSRGRPKKDKIDKEVSDISSSGTETESDEERIPIVRTRAQKRKDTPGPIQTDTTRKTRSRTQRVRQNPAPARRHELQRRRSNRNRK
jgi:hypothetical protein